MHHLRLVAAVAAFNLIVLACFAVFLHQPDASPLRPDAPALSEPEAAVVPASLQPLEGSAPPKPVAPPSVPDVADPVLDAAPESGASGNEAFFASRDAAQFAAARRRVLASTTHARNDYELRIYDATDCLKTVRVVRAAEVDDADGEPLSIEVLVEVVELMVTPDDWKQPGRHISGAGSSLIIRAPAETHESIVNLLADLLR